MILDYFKLAFHSLKSRSVRTWLTMIGIFIGITAVVSLIALGQGMQDSINAEFEKIGKNRIMITPGSGNFGPEGGDLSTGIMTGDDLNIIRKTKGIDVAIPVLANNAKVKFKNEAQFMSVWGFESDENTKEFEQRTSFLELEKGRHLKKGDKYKAIVGYNIAFDRFDKEIQLGNKIEIDEKEFSVVGIQKKAGTGMHDSIIYIPMELARKVYNEPEKVSTIFALVDLSEKPSFIAERVERRLRRFRDVKEGEEDFSVQTAEQTIQQMNTILDVVTIFVVGIAFISLIVGGIGIMNTMYTTVLERTKEIGIMKSIGAKNSHIMILFIVESGVLGLAGGVIGVILGAGIAKAGEFAAVKLGAEIFRASISLQLILGALAFAYFVGTLSGILPARQASKMNPVDALRAAK